MGTVTRRDVFRLASGAGVAAAVPGAMSSPAMSAPDALPSQLRTLPSQPYHFLNEIEAGFVEAAVDHLIPPDDRWPGAAEAGVALYIDRQLAGSFGSGERLYLEGPWSDGTPQQGYQLPFTPAELYRTAMIGLSRYLDSHFGGRRFEQLDRSEQDNLLRSLESGALDLGDVPGAVFFETLLANTIEGYFADPMYGGNQDMAAWRMIGFPGAYANYASLIDQHGLKFTRPPLSAAQVVHAHGDKH